MSEQLNGRVSISNNCRVGTRHFLPRGETLGSGLEIYETDFSRPDPEMS